MEIKPGQEYSHYKNPKRFYEIIGVAKNSETLEEMVIYKALYSDEFPFGQLWARPKSIFLEKVRHKSAEVPRFRLKK
jgi:hypothetical protein